MAELAVTAVGADRPGIIARVTGVLLEHGGNLEDATMTILRGQFAMMLLVDADVAPDTLERDLAEATRDLVGSPKGIWHLAADGDCTWAEFAAAIFEEARVPCRVVPISSDELARPARRPAYSVLRSERPDAPRLPPWREGLRACLARLL